MNNAYKIHSSPRGGGVIILFFIFQHYFFMYFIYILTFFPRANEAGRILQPKNASSRSTLYCTHYYGRLFFIYVVLTCTATVIPCSSSSSSSSSKLLSISMFLFRPETRNAPEDECVTRERRRLERCYYSEF